jgi:N-acetylmuramoyl-L-alanine amidase
MRYSEEKLRNRKSLALFSGNSIHRVRNILPQVPVPRNSQFRGVLLLTTALLSSCNSHRSSSPDRQRNATFVKVTAILDAIANSEDNVIPNAVLNRTKCLVAVPANAGQGIASCIESLNTWTRPALITFTGKRSPQSDLLLFVLGDKEAKSLRSGRLQLQSPQSISRGPLMHTRPALTDADLNFGSLAYEVHGKAIDGASVQGTVTSAESNSASPEKNDPEVRLQRSLASFFNVITPVGIILHHTAVLPTLERVPTDKREVDSFHQAKGFDVVCFGHEYHVAYHYLILPDGDVQAGRPERCQGAHAPGYNAYLGISVAGDFSSKDNPTGARGPAVPTPRQEQALVQLCRRLREKYKFPIQRIMRHSDVSPTQCPGDRFPFVRILSEVGR